MGKIRSFASHVRWTDIEVVLIKGHYERSAWPDLVNMLPGRSRSQIQNKAYGMGIVRYRKPARTADEVREDKRQQMANRRAVDPEGARAYQNANYHANRGARLVTMKAYQRRRFFWLRAGKLMGISAADVGRLWKVQRGRCGITGRRLNRENAQVDHIVAKARGGSDSITNLRWVCAEANLAKRDLSDAEFLALCSDAMTWIGERISLAEDISGGR